MRRPLALLAAVIALAATPAGAGEPLDFDLTQLGPPDPAVWLALPSAVGGPPSAADAQALAGEARVRFARLATDLALALSSSLLQPASTVGHSAFAFDLEVSTTQVSHEIIGTTTYPNSTFPRDYWPTRSLKPTDLLVPSFHVRKAFPFSLELGGRFSYLSQSTYFAAQVEGKWAILEGYQVWPDVAVRLSYTKMLGQRNLELTTTEYDLMTSKRFGINAVTSLTPYLALRLTSVNARTKSLNYAPDDICPAGSTCPPDPTRPATPDEIDTYSAAFPNVNSTLYRTTLGVRFTSFAVSMAAEATYFGGSDQGSKSADASYPEYKVPASLAGAFKFGFEF